MIPAWLKSAIEAKLARVPLSLLEKTVKEIAKAYREGRRSDPVFRTEIGRLCYLAARLPATFGAVEAVCKQIAGQSLETVADLGAGPGTALWAAKEVFPSLKRGFLYEENGPMLDLGKELGRESGLRQEWSLSPLEKAVFSPADLAIASYALGELLHPLAFLETLWSAPFSLLVLIEPGTPRGFSLLREVRSKWLSWGGTVLAPCPHALACPMQGENWCHFGARIPRTSLHRKIKAGLLGYEDEKYAYLILSRSAAPSSCQSGRILRIPQKKKGHVVFTLCTPEGKEEERVISQKDGPLYKEARHSSWGELFPKNVQSEI